MCKMCQSTDCEIKNQIRPRSNSRKMDGYDFDAIDRDNSPVAAVTRSTLDSLIQVGENHE